MLYQDVETVSGIMQLRDRKKYFSMLPVGQAIVKLAERYYDPFLIDVPFVDLKNEAVTDDSVAKRMKKIITVKEKDERFKDASKPEKVVKELKRIDEVFKISGVDTGDAYKQMQEVLVTNSQRIVDEDNKRREEALKAGKRVIIPKGALLNHIQEFLVEYINEQLDQGFNLKLIKESLLNSGYKYADVNSAVVHVVLTQRNQKINKGVIGEVIPSIKYEDTSVSCSLNKTQKNLLDFVSKNPQYGTSQIYKYLGLSPRKGDRLKKKLVDMGLLKVEALKNEKGWKKVLKPTDSALKCLENPGISQKL